MDIINIKTVVQQCNIVVIKFYLWSLKDQMPIWSFHLFKFELFSHEIWHGGVFFFFLKTFPCLVISLSSPSMRASWRPTGHIRSIPMKLGNQFRIQYKGKRHPEAFLRPIPLPIGPRYWVVAGGDTVGFNWKTWKVWWIIIKVGSTAEGLITFSIGKRWVDGSWVTVAVSRMLVRVRGALQS